MPDDTKPKPSPELQEAYWKLQDKLIAARKAVDIARQDITIWEAFYAQYTFEVWRPEYDALSPFVTPQYPTSRAMVVGGVADDGSPVLRLESMNEWRARMERLLEGATHDNAE